MSRLTSLYGFARIQFQLFIIVTGLFSNHWTTYFHFTCTNCDPLVPSDVKPRQPVAVLAIQIGVLASRVPPTAFIVGRAVARAVVVVSIHRTELVPIMERQGVRCVAMVPGNGQPITVVGIRHGKVVVIRQPTVAIYVSHVDTQGSHVVGRQPAYGVVAQPKVFWNRKNYVTNKYFEWSTV